MINITPIITGAVIGFLVYLLICIIAFMYADDPKQNTWTWDDFITFLLFMIAGGSIGYLTIIF